MSPHLRPTPLQLLVAAVYVVTSALALYHGFRFGQKIGGGAVAVVTALNTWLMAVLVVGGLMDSLYRRWQRRRAQAAGLR